MEIERRAQPRPARRPAGAAAPGTRLLGVVATLCLVVGVTLIAGFAYGMLEGVAKQRQLDTSWRATVAANPPPQVPPTTLPPNLMVPVNGVDFSIRVPKLGYTAAVREGVDLSVLYSGPGHYPETPWPGQAGMVGVAAHNVYWINFPELARGDEVDLETRYGTFRYHVTGSRIVQPNDRTILVQGPGRHLTLTTCWPLWAGAFATQRYIIFTEQFDPPPLPAVVGPR